MVRTQNFVGRLLFHLIVDGTDLGLDFQNFLRFS